MPNNESTQGWGRCTPTPEQWLFLKRVQQEPAANQPQFCGPPGQSVKRPLSTVSEQKTQVTVAWSSHVPRSWAVVCFSLRLERKDVQVSNGKHQDCLLIVTLWRSVGVPTPNLIENTNDQKTLLICDWVSLWLVYSPWPSNYHRRVCDHSHNLDLGGASWPCALFNQVRGKSVLGERFNLCFADFFKK